MFPDKIKITDDLIKLIIDTRKEYNLTAYQLSEKIDKNKSWLPNIENKRTKNIAREDLILLFKDFAKDKGMDAEEFVIKYLSPTATVELDDNVSVPNHYLQSSMGIFSPDHEDLHISDEERQKRVEYYTSDKPYEVDLMRLKKKLKDLSDLIIDEFSYCKTSKHRDKMIDMVDTMFANFVGEFAYTQKLYGFPMFYGDSKMVYGKTVAKDFLQKTNSNMESFMALHKLAFAHADLYAEINAEEGRNTLLNDVSSVNEKTDSEEFDMIFYELDGYIYRLHEYLMSAKKEAVVNNHSCNIEFTLLFEYVVKAMNEIIANANLNYRFEYEIPEPNADIDTIIKKSLELNNISYGIKHAIRKK
ncbi:MAG: hypothetical protein IJN64_14160 [Lachnospiraceae bacterium]|nr:hypothetical protein [Lachnospiraceae bacterium]